MKSKTVKTIAMLGAAYVGYKLLTGGSIKGLFGLGDDIPYDINVPYTPQYGYQYPYQYGAGGYGYPGYQSYAPYSSYPTQYPAFGGYGGYGTPYGYPQSAPGFQYNPYGGQSYYGQYIPRVVTPSGGFQGLF